MRYLQIIGTVLCCLLAWIAIEIRATRPIRPVTVGEYTARRTADPKTAADILPIQAVKSHPASGLDVWIRNK
jgi:hypothetical protein